MNLQSFDITVKGVNYSIDVVLEGDDTTLYIEYRDSHEEIEQEELLMLTEYLVNEGFVEFKN